MVLHGEYLRCPTCRLEYSRPWPDGTTFTRLRRHRADFVTPHSAGCPAGFKARW